MQCREGSGAAIIGAPRAQERDRASVELAERRKRGAGRKTSSNERACTAIDPCQYDVQTSHGCVDLSNAIAYVVQTNGSQRRNDLHPCRRRGKTGLHESRGSCGHVPIRVDEVRTQTGRGGSLSKGWRARRLLAADPRGRRSRMTPMPAGPPEAAEERRQHSQHGQPVCRAGECSGPAWSNENTTGQRPSQGYDSPATTFSASPSSSLCDSHSGMLLWLICPIPG